MSRLFVNQLATLDLSLLDPSRGLLGQSWSVDVVLEGALDPQGMVLDFSEVKKRIKSIIDLHFDHRLVVPSAHPGCRLSQSNGCFDLVFELKSGHTIRYQGPSEAIAIIDTQCATPREISAAIHTTLRPMFAENVRHIHLELRTEDIPGASYCYSHGLKRHQGNCQRIAHGHRSQIQIYRDGLRSPELEYQWAGRWQDIFIATRADLYREFQDHQIRYAHFRYTASQGQFDLVLPMDRCYLVDFDSTVENLAEYICGQLSREYPESKFRVMAFEGIGKGAIGISAD
ncbi:MAG: 6-carboxytetrahydropterin synthase [Gammaproteobacteria bacterium]|nr:6-carboxytetrahydropterin synthase [Gammaproteobacteria bacterium]